MDAENLFLLTIVGPIGAVALVVLSVHFFAKSEHGKKMRILKFLKDGPRTDKEMVDLLEIWEAELENELDVFMRQCLIESHTRSPWDSNWNLQKPVTVYSLTIIGRRVLEPKKQDNEVRRYFRY